MSCIKKWNHDRKIVLAQTYYRCCMELFTIKKVPVSSKSRGFRWCHSTQYHSGLDVGQIGLKRVCL